MKTTVLRALPLSVIALTLGALAFVAISLGANSAQAQEEGAVVIQQGFCFAFLPPAPYVETNDSQTVITPSGNTALTCTFEGAPIDATYTTEGFGCITYGGFTTESRFVYTKSGHGTLTCLV